jgi:hypothetical protein
VSSDSEVDSWYDFAQAILLKEGTVRTKCEPSGSALKASSCYLTLSAKAWSWRKMYFFDRACQSTTWQLLQV